MERAFVVVLLAVSVAACSGDAGPTRSSAEATTPTIAPSPSAAAPGGPPVRTCESHVFGELHGWRRSSTIIGPVGFVGLPGYADAGHQVLASKGERYPGLKTLLVIEEGPPVTVTILDPARARLLYDPAGWRNRNRYPLESGATSTVFEPCEGMRSTQFNGALLVTGRVCVTIEVAVQGREPERTEVPIGLRSCG